MQENGTVGTNRQGIAIAGGRCASAQGRTIGGGVRHGLDLNDGVPITEPDARLFCNLIRSYLSYLLTVHQRLGRS